MRLKSIKLAGFKSFVDPTTVAFPTNMSAIVGPNGCGKSNIIDAVRWVMGESSAKNLRGESMADVIFNGSTNRKPVGQASIELLFDNAEGKLGGEYASFAEIGIKRKVERDGQSEYYLNGTKCRRRDITDIFLGTGLGPRSYAIIEQGMISKLIEAKPDDLRIFVEEAAGISKYKERRRETENRMRRTQENLERLTDLREELERQLQHLQRQAQAAERYTELKQEERQLKAELQALQWKALDEQVNNREAAIRDLEVRLEQVLAEQQSIDTDIIKLRESHADQNDTFNEVQGRFYAIGGEISRAEQRIQFITDRSRQLTEDLRQVDINLSQAKSHLEEDLRKQQQWKEELAGIEPELNILAEREEQSTDKLATAEESMTDWQQRWDDFNQTAAKPRQIAEVQQSRIQHLEQALNRIQDRVAKLDDEKNQLVAGDVEDELSLLSEQLAESELNQEQQLEQEQQFKDAIVSRREQLETVTQQLNQSTGRRQELRGKQASLEALQEAALGKSRGAVDSWLESRGLGQGKRIAETLRVANGWEQAVETALGDYLQAVCVDGLDGVANYLSELSSGNLSLLDISATKISASHNSLLNKIEAGSDAVSALLANVLAADDLQSAMAMRSSLSAGQSVMTRDGIWLGSNWLRVNREKDPQAGVIARQQELETLAAELETLEAQIEKLSAEQADLRRTLQDAEQSRDQVAQDLRQSNQRVGQLRSEIAARKARIEQLLVRRDRLNQDISDAREQFLLEQENLGEARLLLQEAIDSMEIDANQREQLLAERDRNRNTLDQARQQARHDKDTAHQLAIRSETLRTQLDTIVNAITRLTEQQEQYSLRREELQEALLTNEDPVEELKLQLETQLEKRLGVEDELNKARLLKEQIEESLRHSEQQRSTVDQRVQQVRIALEHERLQNQTLTVQRETVMEQLLSAKFELDAVLETLPADANHSEWQEKLDSIDRRIQRLGAINLAAIEEYKSQAERKHYLDAQNEDLVDALNTLENAIRKIDKETRGRFKETFDLINSGFGELFPKIFGGGNAYLEMTGDDLLDTGVSIMARPPGKKNSTIHLLSGGEKALTAIALVFSIFRLNPAPFCILDEVDAPLDDVNVGRYIRMVKEMAEKVQFIYITHNKIPMEYASHLLGVTMQEPGVSRLVTVNVEEAAEMALA